MNAKEVGNFLKDLRNERGLTQAELARLLYVSREAISKWERGVNLPDYAALFSLSKFYNISVNEILAAERLNEFNQDRINAVALKIINKNQRAAKKSLVIAVVSIVFTIISFFAYYFAYNFNSLKVYITSAENRDYFIKQGAIVTSKYKSYINLGPIYSEETNKAVTDEDIDKIELYYQFDGERETLLESYNVDNLYIDLKSYNEVVKKKPIDRIVKNLYIDIYKDDELSTLRIISNQDYANSSIIPVFIKDNRYARSFDEEYSMPKYEYKFKPIDDVLTYEFTIDDEPVKCTFTTEEIIKCEMNDISFDYNTHTYYLNIYDEKNIVNYNYHYKKCLSNNCQDYQNIIDKFQEELVD